MITNDNAPTNVTMESLANGMHTLSTGMQAIRAELTALQSWEVTGMQAIRAELTVLQNGEGIQYLSLDKRPGVHLSALPRHPSTT